MKRNIIVAAIVAAVAVIILAISLQPQEGLMIEDAQTRALMSALLDNAYTPLGSADAPITLVEFGDYQCHFCHIFFENTERRIIQDYVDTGLVQMIFKDRTIIGPDSITAAHGARCAEDQGLFWEYHDTVYSHWDGENTGWASQDNLQVYAAEAGVDTEVWSACMESSSHSGMVAASNDDARALGVGGTPAFFVIAPDGTVQHIPGAQPYEQFANVFDDILEMQQ